MPAEQCRVSVIIPAMVAPHCLPKCLEALGRQQLAPYETIVVSGSVSGPQADAVRARGAQPILSETRLGVAAARNKGAAAASGDVCLFVDPDIALAPDAVALAAVAFGDNPDVAAISGLYDGTAGDLVFVEQYNLLADNFARVQGDPDMAPFWAACGAVRKDIFHTCGGFSERYRMPEVQDVELGCLIREAGGVVALHEGLQVGKLGKHSWRTALATAAGLRMFALPRLFLQSRGRYLQYLRMDRNAYIAMVLSLAMLICVIVTFAGMNMLLVFLALGVAWYTANQPLLLFLRDMGGTGFMLRCAALAWLYHICTGVGYGLSWLLWCLMRLGLLGRG